MSDESIKVLRDGLLQRLGTLARKKVVVFRFIRLRLLQKRLDALERVLRG